MTSVCFWALANYYVQMLGLHGKMFGHPCSIELYRYDSIYRLFYCKHTHVYWTRSKYSVKWVWCFHYFVQLMLFSPH